jgi:hypothetical protein
LKSQVSDKQAMEWTENPVTLKVLGLIKGELERIRSTPTADCWVAGEPDRTHENIVNLQARQTVWEDMEAILSGDLDYFEEIENE